MMKILVIIILALGLTINGYAGRTKAHKAKFKRATTVLRVARENFQRYPKATFDEYVNLESSPLAVRAFYQMKVEAVRHLVKSSSERKLKSKRGFKKFCKDMLKKDFRKERYTGPRLMQWLVQNTMKMGLFIEKTNMESKLTKRAEQRLKNVSKWLGISQMSYSAVFRNILYN